MRRILDNLVPPTSGQRFPALDGLRALAAMAVVFVHVPPTSHTWFIHYGAAAVATFFTLSAFLLYYPCTAPDPKRDWRLYYRRRFFRIYPAFWVALVPAIALRLGLHLPATTAQLASWFPCLVCLPAWGRVPLLAAWSLPAEIQFYAVLPLLVWLVSRKPFLSIGIALVIAMVAQAVVPLSVYSILPRPALVTNWPFLALPFVFGMLAARCVRHYPRLGRYLAPAGLAMLVAYGPIAQFQPAFLNSFLGRLFMFHMPWLWNSVGAFLFILGLTTENGVGSSIFSARPVRCLGIVGYGLFLFHQPVIAFSVVVLGRIPGAIVGLPLTIAVAVLSYLYIEAPCIRFASRHGARRPLLVAPASAESRSAP